MNAPSNVMIYSRYLSHVEIVYRPGERDLARKFLGLLGIEAEDAMGGQFMMSVIERETFEPLHFANFMGGSEVHPEQWVFDQALMAAVSDGPLAESFAEYQQKLDRDPTSGMHIGIHFSTVAAWEKAVARLGNVFEDFPELDGRFRICSVTRPGDSDSLAPLYQAFIWTDVVASGSLALGQRFELSAVDPADLTEA